MPWLYQTVVLTILVHPSPLPQPQVLALRQENEWLKASLAEALNSPVNKQLRLPPTLLLR